MYWSRGKKKQKTKAGNRSGNPQNGEFRLGFLALVDLPYRAVFAGMAILFGHLMKHVFVQHLVEAKP